MRTTIALIVLIIILALFVVDAKAQNNPAISVSNGINSPVNPVQSNSNLVNSTSQGGMGGAGGLGGAGGDGGLGGIGYGGDANATGGTGIGHGGDGGTGIGHGGAGGIGYGGEAHGGAGGAGGIGQGGSGTGGDATNAGNAQSVHFDQIRQSPSVFLGPAMPTAVCQGTFGIFASFLAGFGFAMSHTLKQCEVREEARSLTGMGRPDQAFVLMCMNATYSSQLPACKSALK